MFSNSFSHGHAVKEQKRGSMEPVIRKEAFTVPNSEDGGRKTVTQLLTDFAENTTLLGLGQIYRKKNLFWLVATLLTLTMSIYQSWNVTKEFFQGKTTQRVTLRNIPLLPVPSITVCSHIVLPWDFKFSLIDGYDTDAIALKSQQCKSKEDEKLLTKLSRQNRAVVSQYIRKLTLEERIEFSQNYTDFIEDCDMSEDPCEMPGLLYYFNNPFYGNCFTFNPAFGPYERKLTDMMGQFVLHVSITKGYRLTGIRRTVGVLVHSPGTAPILDSPGVQNLNEDKALDISLKITEKSFLKKIVDSKPTCVPDDDEDYRRRSMYYTDETPYVYSLEACMMTCQQRLMARSCGIINPALPLQNPEYEARLNTTLPPLSLSCEVEENIDTEFCDCPLPCNLTNYVMTVDTTDYLYTVCNNSENGTELNSSKASVTIYFSGNTAERVEELFVHGWPEFLGFLGGNLSLWTGLCILSVLELVELAIQLMIFCLKRRKPARNPPSHAIRFSHQFIRKQNTEH